MLTLDGTSTNDNHWVELMLNNNNTTDTKCTAINAPIFMYISLLSVGALLS